MNRRVFLGLVGAFAFGAALPVAADTSYTDPLGRFALSIPDGWTQEQSTVNAIAGAWATDGGNAQFTVLYTQVNDGTTGESLEASFLPVITALPGYTENDRRDVTLTDGEVPLLDYYMTGASGNVARVQQIFLTHGLDGFVLTFRIAATDAAKYAMVVGSMVGSFTYTVAQ